MIILRYARHSVGDSSDKNDKTQMLSDSQVLEVKPSTPKLPARASGDDKNDRSVWKGLVVGADDFAPPPPATSSGGRWIVLGILAAAAIGAGAYLVWPRTSAPVVTPGPIDAAAKPAVAPPVDAMPQDAAPDATSVEDAAEPPADAAVPPDAAVRPDAGVRVIKRKPPPKRMIKHKH
jgi:hypothetical protein